MINTETPEMGTVTGSQQIGIVSYDGQLHRDTVKAGTFKDLRVLRKDPTIALGRGLLVSGILAGAWSVESEEEVKEVVDFITEVMLPLRESIMQAAVAFGRVDFGFMPFEKIFAIKNGRLVIQRLKPLLQDITTILVTTGGQFAGFRQSGVGITFRVDVPLEKCLLVNFDVEAGALYGYPLLENIRASQDAWTECDKGAKKYDKKIAGAHWQLHYPVGDTIINDEPKDNYDIAMEMLAALEASGSIVVPSTVATEIQELNQEHISKLYQWNVELISDLSPRQASFIEREKYLDGLKLRGLLIPERVCTEGQYGTKAEAGEHIGLAITNMQECDKQITKAVNEQVVNQLLELNWGEELVGKVRLVAAPLVDLQLEFLRKLYLAVSGKQVDVVALQEKLGVPLGEKPVVPPQLRKEPEDVKPDATAED